MSTRGRGRQQPLRSRLFSWPGTPAAPPPQQGTSRRQPSRVTTTSSAQPQSPESSAEGQPSPLPSQPRPQPHLSPSGEPSSAGPVPQMGPAPSRPAASDTRPPWAPPGPAPTAARAPPLTSPAPSDGASPAPPQPPRRIPSRQEPRPYTQPPSPPGPPSLTQAAPALPGAPPPSPPPPRPSPAPPAVTTEPKAPSPTPSPALSASPKEIPEVPTPAPGALPPEAAPTKHDGKEEEATASPAAKLQPPETSPEKDQTAIDPASMRSEVARQPPAVEAGEKHIPTATQTARHPSPEEEQRGTTGGRLPPREDELHQKQTKHRSKPPKPEAEEEEEKVLEAEPEAKEEEKLVIGPEIEKKVDGTDHGEKRTVNQAELEQESGSYRSRNTDVNTEEEVKKETPNSSPLPIPAQNPQIRDRPETPSGSSTQETQPAPLERTQIKNSREAAEAAEKTKQATQEPQQQQPTHDHPQRTRGERLSDAQPAREKQAPVPEKEPPAPPAGATKGKEGKIAISTVARASASSEGEQSGGLHKEIKEGISRLVQSLAVQHTKQTGGGYGISIITLAGDNHGATMYVGGHKTPSREGKKNVFVHKGPSANDGGGGATAPGEDGGQKKTEQRLVPTTETNANVNSNVQAVNNSILHDSCCSEENPGVHLFLSSRPPELAPQKEAATPAQPQRPRTSAPLLPKMAPEPTVRRRCLRAMFLESSDDDPENPQKPRRHGCRFSCEDRKGGKGGQDGTPKG